MLFPAKRSLVAVDIGGYSVKIVQLKKSTVGYELLNMGIINLPPDSWIEGEIENVEAVTAVVNNLLKSEKIVNKNVVVAISGQSVIIKKISVPRMSYKELGDMIREEAEQYIPFDLEEVNLDFQIVEKVVPPTSGGEEGADAGMAPEEDHQMDVLIVAARKDTIEAYQKVMAGAGLNLRVLDLDVFALENAFEYNHQTEYGKTIALINIGGSMTNVNIIEDGVTVFTRDIPVGGNIISEEIQTKLSVGYTEAEKLKLGIMFDDFTREQVAEYVVSGVELIAVDIRKTFDLYEQTSDFKITKVFLGGGSAQMVGLDAVLARQLDMEVEMIKTFRNITINAEKFDPDYVKAMEPAMFLPVGLAMRMVDDK